MSSGPRRPTRSRCSPGEAARRNRRANHGIPDEDRQLSRSTIPKGFYFGQALAGYGIMWNARYCKANKLPEPKEWEDLAKPRLLRPRLDLRAVALRHHAPHRRDHPAGRRLGQGLGHRSRDRRQLRRDHRALVRRARRRQHRPGRLRHRDRLLRPRREGLGLSGRVRLSVGDHDRAGQHRHRRQREERRRPKPSSQFPLSPEARQLLLEPKIRRLPVLPAIYAKAPADYPEPVQGTIQAKVNFDAELSESRNDVVVSLFDQLITFRLKELKAATKAIHEAEKRLGQQGQRAARELRRSARLSPPCRSTKQQAHGQGAAAAFTGDKEKTRAQAELEQQWAASPRRSTRGQGQGRRGAKLTRADAARRACAARRRRARAGRSRWRSRDRAFLVAVPGRAGRDGDLRRLHREGDGGFTLVTSSTSCQICSCASRSGTRSTSRRMTVVVRVDARAAARLPHHALRVPRRER